MGQQQLILLVLATIIVGIAIILGIRAFTENEAKSNADALMQDAVTIAHDVQAWVKKPAPFGGSATKTGTPWTSATMPLIGRNATHVTGNGTCTMGANALITCTSFDNGAGISATGTAGTGELNKVEVIVCGVGHDDMVGAYRLQNGQTASAAPTCPS